MKNFTAQVTICRTTNNKSGDSIRIEINDASNGIRVVDAVVQLADFAQAITGLYRVPCTGTLYAPELAGMVRETKTEHVLVRDPFGKDRERRVAEAVARFEVDGWRGRVSDATNSHCRVSVDTEGCTYKVHYVRFVPPAEDDTERARRLA